MAYNNGFPVNYQYYQQPVMPQMMQPVQQMPMPQMQQQAQQAQAVTQQMNQNAQYPMVQSGFVRVRNENEARMYPVQPGCSITFVDESIPYCYTKTVNMGQLDRPIFEKYRLVKEEDAPAPVEAPNKPVEMPMIDSTNFATKDDIRAFRGEIDGLKADLEAFRGDLYGIAGKKTTTRKKEVTTDE